MEIGNRIGPYEIRQPLGQGGMAQVWKAWHLRLHRFEALKIPLLRQPEAARSEAARSELESEREFIGRFLHEARIAAGLRHPHIATIYSVSEADAPQPFFAMELVEGGDLAALIHARKRLPVDEALPILEAVAAALDYAHEKGVVHRDIKPANVLLEAGPDGWSPKVVDFGIARAAQWSSQGSSQGAGEATLSEDASLAGTPEYMSPEQAGSGESVGPRSDLYSLAIVAYEMLCGRPPFSVAGGAGPISILVQHRCDLPPRPSQWHSDLAPGLNEVMLRALAKSPQERPASCAEFVHALRQASQAQAQVLGGAAQALANTFAPSQAPPSTWEQDAAVIAALAASLEDEVDAQGDKPRATPQPSPTLAPLASTSASTSAPVDASRVAVTLVQPLVPPLALLAPAQNARGEKSGKSAKSLARKPRGKAQRWILPATAVGALSLGAALVATGTSRTSPSVLLPSTSDTSSTSEVAVPEEAAAPEETAAINSAQADPTQADPTGTPGEVQERARGMAQEARAEGMAQEARREKIEVIDSLLVLRKRQEDDLLRPEEAAASRRKLLARLSRALAQTEAALELDENNETAWEQKAALLFLMGRFEQAYGTSKAALQKFPGNPDLKDARDKARDRLQRALQRGA